MAIESMGQYTGGAVVLALFIIWKLVEEMIRFRGIKNYRKVAGHNPGPKCKWADEDHKWLLEIRDNTKNNNRVIGKLETFLDKELNE